MFVLFVWVAHCSEQEMTLDSHRFSFSWTGARPNTRNGAICQWWSAYWSWHAEDPWYIYLGLEKAHVFRDHLQGPSWAVSINPAEVSFIWHVLMLLLPSAKLCSGGLIGSQSTFCLFSIQKKPIVWCSCDSQVLSSSTKIIMVAVAAPA